MKLLGVKRSDYKHTWDHISAADDLAMIGVAGTSETESFFNSGEVTADTLREVLRIQKDDVVLEIGCGVGRIGKALAPQCRKWIGCDISSQMLRHAATNLNQLDNVELFELLACALEPIPSASIDKAYCSAVFMHLDEWDRFQYVQESFRILRPGGRSYFDNINLGGDVGWEIFQQMKKYDERLRPPNISKSSTAEELTIYLSRAGFTDIEAFPGSHFVAVAGKKPG
jgi:ubiquinone/menaquinone biosynthesis C-methylase UbiE